MTRVLRMLSGAILGASLCLVIGASLAGVVELITLPNTHPMDRWYLGGRVAALAIVSSMLVGFVAGAASRASEHGLPLLKSVMVVALAAIAATGSLIFVGKGFLLLVPLGGVMVGGIVVVLVGLKKTRCVPTTKQENQDIANKS